VGEYSQQMKKLWTAALVGVLLLTGCSGKLTKQSTSSKTSESSRTAKKVNKSTNTTQSKSSKQVTAQSSSKSTKATTTLWNASKEKQLSAFMKSWQAKMGQTYQGTYDGKQPNHLGYIFPKAITSGEMNNRVSWGNQPVDLSWSTNGENGKEFQIVAVATGGKDGGESFPTSYLFCLHNQRPVVFMSQTTNGDTFYIQDTQNAELQAGFAKIVTGVKPAIKTDASLNADVEPAVNASPQRMPNGYNGTWYYKDDYGVETMPTVKESEIKLMYVDDMTPKMLNIRGIDQTAGDGTFEYLRYKYYDGRQIPVMMVAGGAGVWFYGNGYSSRTIATQLDGLKYGDETKTQDEDMN